jgi:fumarate hydratase class II
MNVPLTHHERAMAAHERAVAALGAYTAFFKHLEKGPNDLRLLSCVPLSGTL